MEKYKNTFIKFLKTPIFIVPLIIVIIASYGYLLTHSTVNIDSLTYELYHENNLLLGQKRVMSPLIEKIFHTMNYYPFFGDFLGLLLITIWAILFCTVFDVITKSKIKIGAYTIFACIFMSYPLIMDEIAAATMSICIGLGFCFIAIALALMNEFARQNKDKFLILSTIIIFGAISLYESFALVYIIGTLAIMLLKILFVNEKKLKLREHILEGLKFALPLILAFLCNIIIPNLIIAIFKIPMNTFADRGSKYAELGMIGGLKYFIFSVLKTYIASALGYFPITVFVISIIIAITMGIIMSVKKKDGTIFLLFLGMIITLFLICIIQGKDAPYRTCQQFHLFIGLIFMLLSNILISKDIKKFIKNAAFFIIGIILFYQVKTTYTLQYINDLRFQKEQTDMKTIANQLLSKYDVENKPIIFIGKYRESAEVLDAITIKPGTLQYKINEYLNTKLPGYDNQDEERYVQNSISNHIGWGMYAFGNKYTLESQIIRYFKYLGYGEFKAPEPKMYDEACKSIIENDTPRWPKEGSIVETDNFIYVYF